MKQAIADEVQKQLAASQTAAANPQAANTQTAPSDGQVPDALSPSERVFVVASEIDTALPNGQECGLTGGDVLMRLTDTPDDNQNVNCQRPEQQEGGLRHRPDRSSFRQRPPGNAQSFPGAA